MLVGLLASPHTGWFPLNFETPLHRAHRVFGLILLLFNLGLEFDQDEFFGNFGKLIISGGSYIVINMGVGLALRLHGRLGHPRGADHRGHDGDLVERDRHEAADRAATAWPTPRRR